MSRTHALSLAVIVCLAWNTIAFAQKGAKPKPTTQSATASFRCNGPNPPDGPDPCGGDDFVLSDSITGDGFTYVGDLASSSGAFLRWDGEFDFDLRGGSRTVYLNFEHQVAGPSGAFYRKNFTEATLNQFHFNTHVLDPNGQEFDGGLTDIPPGESWPARIKSYWTDPYCDCDFTIRFNASGYPGSTNVTVTRDFTNPNQWTIEASASDIAQLVSPPQSTKGRPTGLTDEGFYHLPFKITFTLP
jgi:hypothetical protein